MNREAFKAAYMEAMDNAKYIAYNPNYADASYRDYVSDKMINSVMSDDSRHDWLKYNPAMRQAAKKFGFKTSKPFREAVRGWATLKAS